MCRPEFNLENYLGFSHLCGVSVKIFIIFGSETDHPFFCMSIRVTMSIQVYEMQSSMKSSVLSDSFHCLPEMTFF